MLLIDCPILEAHIQPRIGLQFYHSDLSLLSSQLLSLQPYAFSVVVGKIYLTQLVLKIGCLFVLPLSDLWPLLEGFPYQHFWPAVLQQARNQDDQIP